MRGVLLLTLTSWLACISVTKTSSVFLADAAGIRNSRGESKLAGSSSVEERDAEQNALDRAALGTSSCPPCNATQCQNQPCTLADRFACIAGTAAGGCAAGASDWEHNAQCSECCDVTGCEISCPLCSNMSSLCGPPPFCFPETPYLCTAGPDKNGCGSNETWRDTKGCTACCEVICSTTAAPSSGPPTPIPPPTPPPTPRPTMSPPATSCPQCNASLCDHPAPPCGRDVPFVCLSMTPHYGCNNVSWADKPGCSECCDLSPICYPPRPPSPWDAVPPSENCTLTEEGPYLAPNPEATPYGGIDVSPFGCREHISNDSDCCGVTPRFNWILSTCFRNQSKHESMACLHPYSNTSALDIHYISAYQWNSTHWVKDPTSSVAANRSAGEEYVDFEARGMFVGGGYHQDWDIKYAPTTNNSGTMGLGPPGMLFVMSAGHFAWSAFYLLNQLTLNRGPGGEVVRINCWQYGSGELDLIESPFWADVIIPPERLYTTITADAGRCFPVQKNVPEQFHKECNSPYCCEQCSCPNGTLCFGKEKDFGFQAMGCIPEVNKSHIPSGSTIWTVDDNELACGERFGGVAGGSTSNAYFEQTSINGTGEFIYAAVVDFDGVKVYRWPINEGTEADLEELSPTWPGIGKYESADVLKYSAPKDLSSFQHKAPCDDPSKKCIIYEPSCTGDCPILSAAGDFGPDELAGGYAAEAARDGLNWWNLFNKTVDDSQITVDSLAKWEHVPTFTPPLPFYCNKSCGEDFCHELTRCPFDSPYECLSGDGAGGCNNNSRFWPLSHHCSDCCDVRLCAVPCGPCNQTICDEKPPLCPPATDPYVCTSGESIKGCSGVKDYWPSVPSCDSCCDLQECVPLPTSQKLGGEEIAQELLKEEEAETSSNFLSRLWSSITGSGDLLTSWTGLALFILAVVVEVALLYACCSRTSKHKGG